MPGERGSGAEGWQGSVPPRQQQQQLLQARTEGSRGGQAYQTAYSPVPVQPPRLVTAWESCKSLKADLVIAPHLGKLGRLPVGDPAQTFPLSFCDCVHALPQLPEKALSLQNMNIKSWMKRGNSHGNSDKHQKMGHEGEGKEICDHLIKMCSYGMLPGCLSFKTCLWTAQGRSKGGKGRGWSRECSASPSAAGLKDGGIS